LIMSLLEEQESLILDVLNSQNAHIPLTFEEFHNLVNESRITAGLVEITDKDDVLLLLRFLKSKGLLNYSPLIEVVTDKVLLAIKLKASAITQIDFDIVKLKKLHMRLNVQVHDLSKSIKDLTDSAKNSLLQSNDRKMALYQLKRRKLLEQTQDERLRSLHSLDDILFRICSVSDDEQILAAYKTGAKALKQLMPDADEIDETMDELQDLLTGHEEISQSLSPSVEYSEFEDELEALLNLDKVSIVSSKEERENIEISAGMSSDVEHNNATKAEADKQKVPDLA
jgi:replicative superfamily II helicase